MSIWIVAAAPLIGLLLALFGAGGGMVTVPLLTYGLDFPLKEAIAASLWIVAAVSLVALVRQRAWHSLNLKLLAFFAAGGIAGSVIGSQLGLAMPETLQAGMFGTLVLFVAWWMRKPRPEQAVSGTPTCRCMLAMATGVVLGIVTGILGVGGGFLMVPALILLGVSGYKTAVAHSLALVSINALTAAIGYAPNIALPLTPMLLIAGLASVGSLVGGAMMARLPASRLQTAFSVMLVVIGGMMLTQAATAI
jgi:uncharacterized membrane protein YfcA